MARISQNDFESQTGGKQHEILEFDALSTDVVSAPDSKFVSDSEITREGQDLVLEISGGDKLVIENYFSAETSPLIEGPDGSILTANLVNSFLSSDPQYANAETMSDLSPIGAVEELIGNANIIRSDGTSEPLTLGSPVYQGDTIETDADGAVNIVFIDETSLAVSENARVSLDEYQFDPSTESGTTNLSVLRGVFVFTSGLIGRDDPDDVKIDTPVGSIGIRGTIIAGKIYPGGESEITVLEGAIVVKNGLMETTLSQQYESVSLGGFRSRMKDNVVKEAEEVKDTYGSVGDVLPRLFSSINDNIRQRKENKQERREERQEEKELLDGEKEVKKESKEAEETSEKDTSKLNLIDPTIDLKPDLVSNEITDNKNHFLDKIRKIRSFIRGFLNELFKRFDLVDPEVFEKDLEVNTGPVRLFENTKDGQFIAKLSAVGGKDGPTDFNFENGTKISSDTYFEIVKTDGRNAEIQLTTAGRGALTGTAINTILGSGFRVNVTDSDGNLRFLDFVAPTVLDFAVNLNTSGGKFYDVIGNVQDRPEKIGDINGDGIEDVLGFFGPSDSILIRDGSNLPGAPLADFTANFGSNINSADGIGDINNDGYADFVFAAPGNFTGGGQAFIVEGGSGSLTPVSLGAGSGNDQLGYAVAGIGDFDGDGKSDYAFSTPGSDNGGTDRGEVRIRLGAGPFLTIAGHENMLELGGFIDGLGDVDGDGLSDVIIGANAVNQSNGHYEAYILRGVDGAIPTNTSTLTTISTPHEIVAGGAVGDINGDGYDDIAVSLEMGSDVNTYIIFGSNALSGTLDMDFLENPDNALKLRHVGAAGNGEYEITALDDVTGDGFDDIQLGISGGEQFIVNGKNSGGVVTDGSANDGAGNVGVIGATANDQSLAGDVHFMDNNNTGLSMKGGAGRNDFSLNNNSFKNIDGGAGNFDTIRYGGGTLLNFENVNFEQISQIEQIHFSQNSSIIQLTAENIFNMLKTSDNGSLTIELGSTNGTAATNGSLIINSAANQSDDAAGILAALQENGNGASATYNGVNGAGNHHFEIGGYNLYVQDDPGLSIAVN